MTTKHTTSLTALFFALFACAQGEVEFEGETTTNTAASSGGSSAGGSGGGTSVCAQDCSEIDTPECVKAVCNEGQYQGIVGECVVVPDEGTSCEDGQFCTIDDTCDANGICVGGGQNDCGMDAPTCQLVTCDEVAKSCSTMPAPAGEVCDPGNLCVTGATCNAFGQCEGFTNDCFFAPVPNDCHVAVCNPMNGMCEPQPGNEGLGCVDTMDLCTVGKTCSSGTCVGGSPKDCSALTVGCFNGVCDTVNGQCFSQPIMPGQNCASATDDCNQGICDTMGNCNPNPINQGMTCDDGLSCTTGTTCNNGSCAGGTSTVTVYLFEDFASNAAGWTLDNSWQIGPAVASGPTGSCGNGDPGNDFTATTDNGLAGVFIGGNVPQSVTNGFLWITSPTVNTASAPQVWLQYRRWLNSDYPNFMTNKVQVYNGSQWIDVWVQPNDFNVIADNSWTYHSFDISPHKNSNMRVRFGYEIGSTGVFLCSSWNLDDVLIASGACP